MNTELRCFGTDGIRGPAMEGLLSLENVSRWGQAWAAVAAERGIQAMVVGWDPRLSSEPLLKAFLGGWGDRIPVRLLGVVPTPAVAWVVSQSERTWGLMISASHNPPADNGLKGFDENGDKLSEEDEAAIETAFENTSPIPSAEGLALIDDRAVQAYIAHLGTLNVPLGLRVAVDCAHGATAAWAPRLLDHLDAKWLGIPADGARINVGVGSTHMEALQEIVRSGQADLGIAFDGDGDRCLMVAPDGSLLDGDQLLWLLTLDARQQGIEVPGVIGTLMTNAGLEHALADAGVPFVRTPVGDKFMVREMARRNWHLAAEASGHIIQRHLGPSGDGLATTLAVLGALSRRTVESRWDWCFSPWPLRLVNLVASNRIPLEACARLSSVWQDLEKHQGDRLRIVIRWSGTEPKLRLMVEARSEDLVDSALDQLTAAARLDLGL